MEKSYVTLLTCPICQKENGKLALDRRLKKTFEMHTIDPGDVCDECREKYLKEGVMLIDPKTGRLIVLRDEAFSRLFNREIPKHKIAFCDSDVIEKIEDLNRQRQEKDPDKCDECGGNLVESTERRDNGNSETITECKGCGKVWSSH